MCPWGPEGESGLPNPVRRHVTPGGGVPVRNVIDPTFSILKAFSITRFWEDHLVGEKAAAAVSH